MLVLTAVVLLSLLSRSYKGSTGNLSRHPCVAKAPTQQKASLLAFMEQTPTFEKMCVRWMVLTFQAISVVEHEAFSSMIHSLSPRIRVPTRRDVVADLASLETTAREGILQELEGQFAALTQDAWTSGAMDAFLSLTTHYLDENFAAHSLTVECSPFPGSHTGEAIAAKTEQMLQRAGVPLSHVSAIVADNAANQALAGRLSDFDSVACVPHTLQLTVKQILDEPEVAETLAVSRSIVGSFKHSALKCAELKEEQKRLGLRMRRLLQDVRTRWSSTFRHLVTLLENKRAVNVMCSRYCAPEGAVIDINVDATSNCPLQSVASETPVSFVAGCALRLL
jgi:hypothetical protein